VEIQKVATSSRERQEYQEVPRTVTFADQELGEEKWETNRVLNEVEQEVKQATFDGYPAKNGKMKAEKLMKNTMGGLKFSSEKRRKQPVKIKEK